MNAPSNGPAGAPGGPAFLITIDTEGDNIWSNPSEITTRNSRFLPRFQALCERYGLKPTYLTNFEMASCDRFAEFGCDAAGRGTAEIGMHLHAWNSPPITGTRGRKGMPYLIEFPDEIIVEKVRFMTGLLEEKFGARPVSHRAGRWAFNESYAKILIDHGYRTDCSVTPHVSWGNSKGFDDGNGGSDYRGFPAEPYFIDPSDIRRAGRSQMLEIPMTIVASVAPLGTAVRSLSQLMPGPIRKATSRLFPAVRWFRPNGRNLGSMLELLRRRRGSSYIEFMLHSSELMPGGSPTFPTERSIEVLYDQLDELFAEAAATYRGLTLGEFREAFERQTAGAA